jgi:hypothetical protein
MLVYRASQATCSAGPGSGEHTRFNDGPNDEYRHVVVTPWFGLD